MTSLFGKMLPLFVGVRRVEDLFTEAVARLFELRPKVCLEWLEEIGAISPQSKDDEFRRIVQVYAQKPYGNSRMDMLAEIARVSKNGDVEPHTELVVIESKLGSREGKGQLSKYAAHLKQMSGNRKTLVYITRAYEPKDKAETVGETEGVDFLQLRWHDFYRFLQNIEKDALIEELMLFMNEQGMSRSHSLSVTDLMALSGVPRAFEIFDEALDDEIRVELESLAGSKVKNKTQSMNQLRWNQRYVTMVMLHGEDLLCFVGFDLSDPAGYPWVTVNLEARPNATRKDLSVSAMEKVVGAFNEDWEGYDLENVTEWSGIGRGKLLSDFLHEEDHIAAIKRFFIESIHQLRDELTEFKKENPELPWDGGS